MITITLSNMFFVCAFVYVLIGMAVMILVSLMGKTSIGVVDFVVFGFFWPVLLAAVLLVIIFTPILRFFRGM